MANHRMKALDVLRGITIAGMILVNNPGSWSYVYSPLDHAEFNGLTPTDLVFPFFMFVMGYSIFLSFKKYDFILNSESVKRIFRRGILLYFVGIIVGVAAKLILGTFSFESIRILGVFQRLGISYIVASLIVTWIKPKGLLYPTIMILAAYSVVLLLGHGFEHSSENILAKIDPLVLGESHILHDGGISLDPEGVLSTIPAIAHVLLGCYIAYVIYRYPSVRDKALHVLLFASLFLIVGYLLSYGIPLNKKVWSSTFVITTIGWAMAVLGLLIFMIDIKGKDEFFKFFTVFGMNSLSTYLFSTVVALSLMGTGWGKCLFESLEYIFGNYPASAIYAILNVLFSWFFAFILYKKNIVIKL